MKIKFFGDLFPTKDIQLDSLLCDADLSIVNLEVPLTETEKPIVKAGPTLKGSKTNFAKIAKQFTGKLFVNLSNNHMGDYGVKGINDTLQCLEHLGIAYGGVEENNLIKETIIDNIAIICLCEEQFGLSQKNTLGVVYHSPQIYKKIRELKDQGFFVIVSSHMAAEMNLWPAPFMQDYFRSLIDVGADIVFNHHSHIPQGYELYNGKHIIYGTGNFIVDYTKWSKHKNTTWGLCYELDTTSSELTIKSYEIFSNNEIKIIPTPMEYIDDCNSPLKDRDLLESLWQEWSMQSFMQCYKAYLWQNNTKIKTKKLFFKSLKSLFKREKFVEIDTEKPFTEHRYALVYHVFSTTAHNLAIKTALGLQCGEINDVRNELSKKLFKKYQDQYNEN